MSKVVEALRLEIVRLSRKEIRAAIGPTARGVVALRHSVASLGKRMAAVEKRVKAAIQAVEAGKTPAEIAQSERDASRMSAYLMKKLRQRLGISQGELALLIGVSAPAVASWEQGRAKPRGESRAAIIALRGLTPKQAREMVESKKKPRRKRR